ncbi:YolD-like protein [Seinonella peptonophila]|uniref:YolD-like protein n=1 Tax=Seinonella peptonophila TaxID=112248 RepID=A0A1M4VQB7_9BACL|nr:YolD-like family protein [Seinonella peptonophila]SHE71050.1 YolD-like protein [Seinonella peptonophila]
MILNRKNLLWEGSRMFLPEHREQLKEQRDASSKQSLPMWDEDYIQEMNFLIQEAIHCGFPIRVTYFEQGKQRTFYGFIHQVYPHELALLLVNGREKRRIHFSTLMQLERWENDEHEQTD